MNKNWNELDIKQRKRILITSIIVCFIIAIIVIATWNFIDSKVLKNLFTEEDNKYMYNYIEETYGNGETFHIVSQKNKRVKTNNKVGAESTIIGYFDSQENCYLVSFSKYNNEPVKYMFTMNDDRCKKENLSGYNK